MKQCSAFSTRCLCFSIIIIMKINNFLLYICTTLYKIDCEDIKKDTKARNISRRFEVELSGILLTPCTTPTSVHVTLELSL